MMESAGNGQPGVSSPSGGGIRVIDNVSCRGDIYAGESPSDHGEGQTDCRESVEVWEGHILELRVRSPG